MPFRELHPTAEANSTTALGQRESPKVRLAKGWRGPKHSAKHSAADDLPDLAGPSPAIDSCED